MVQEERRQRVFLSKDKKEEDKKKDSYSNFQGFGKSTVKYERLEEEEGRKKKDAYSNYEGFGKTKDFKYSKF